MTPLEFYSYIRYLIIYDLRSTCPVYACDWPAISLSITVNSEGKISSTVYGISASKPNNANIWTEREEKHSRETWKRKK